MSSRFRPPQQSRSQDTLARILDAAERVMAEKSFSEATLAEIMNSAGVTVGAFYRRFPDKDALLHHLDDRFFSEVHQLADELLDPARWEGKPLSAIIYKVAEQAVQLYRARRGLLRSLFLRARTDAVIQDTARRVNSHFVERMKVALASHRDDIRHPQPDRAIELGFMMLLGAVRELVLFGEVWQQNGIAGDDLDRELARAYLAYLGAPLTG